MVELNCFAKVFKLSMKLSMKQTLTDVCQGPKKRLTATSALFSKLVSCSPSNMDEHEEEKGEDVKSMLQNAIERMEMRIDRLEQQRASSSSSAESSSRPAFSFVCFYCLCHFFTGNLEIFNVNLSINCQKYWFPLFICGFSTYSQNSAKFCVFGQIIL